MAGDCKVVQCYAVSDSWSLVVRAIIDSVQSEDVLDRSKINHRMFNVYVDPFN